MKIIFSLLLLSQFSSQLSLASFSENQVRYFSGPELQWYLYQLGIRNDQQECLLLRDSSGRALGVNSSATGNPSSGGPTISTVGVISLCVDKHFERISTLSGQIETQGILLGESNVKELNQKYQNYWYTMTWSQLDKNLKNQIIDHLVLHILGPDSVIEDYQLVKSAKEFKDDLKSKVSEIESKTVTQVLARITLSLILRDESLSY